MIFAKFDLDGTLVDTLSLIHLALGELGYMVHPKRDSFNFKFIKGCEPPPDFQWDVFFYRLFTERFDEITVIDPFVEEFISKIYEKGGQIGIITSRPNGMLMHFCIEKMLKKLFPGVKFMIVIVENGGEKHKYLGLCDTFFDDRRKTCIDLSHRGSLVFIRDADYNQHNSVKCIDVTEIINPLEINLGTIVRYKDFGDLLKYGVHKLIAPF